ncbi:MAG TPA: hypothetical protein VFF65_12065 [Phycisphaerales bacterium]|nr:hypothetical protein [Phycisphaerales bacterium]
MPEPTHFEPAALAAFTQLGIAVCAQADRTFANWNAGWQPLAPDCPAMYRRDKLETAVVHLGTYTSREDATSALLPLAEELYLHSGLVPYGRCAARSVPPIEESKTPAQDFLVHYAIPCIAWAVVHGTQSPPTEADWERAAQRALHAWRSPFVEWVTIGHLKGAGPDRGETVKFGDSIDLLWQHEPLSHLVHDPSPPWVGSRAHTMGAFVAHTYADKGNAADGWMYEKYLKILKTVSLLRLYAPGHYGIEQFAVVPSDAFFHTGPLGQCDLPGDAVAPSVWRWLDGTWITQAMADRCTGTLAKWTESSPMSMLAVALERFTLASSRSNDEDVMIDLLIALEGSLLAGNEKEQLKVRCAIRGSYLLGDEEEPVSTHEFLRRAYDARSMIVHGAKRLAEMKDKDRAGLPPDEFLERCYHIVRRVLLRFVEAAAAGTKPEDFAKAIDKGIVERFDRRPGAGSS